MLLLEDTGQVRWVPRTGFLKWHKAQRVDPALQEDPSRVLVFMLELQAIRRLK